MANDLKRLHEVMGRLDKTLKSEINEVFGFSSKEKETKANEQQIAKAKQEIQNYPP
jgi:hypothetical protein